MNERVLVAAMLLKIGWGAKGGLLASRTVLGSRAGGALEAWRRVFVLGRQRYERKCVLSCASVRTHCLAKLAACPCVVGTGMAASH
jgi:hypothetical protein